MKSEIFYEKMIYKLKNKALFKLNRLFNEN